MPIGSYAALGDGRTVALVAADGRVDWWSLPRMDAPPGFAALVDPSRGGYIEMTPEEPFEVSRRYADGTNVLETTFHTRAGSARLTDALAVGRSGPLPWSELIRRVEGLEGSICLRWRVVPGERFGMSRPWIQRSGAGTVVHIGDQLLAIRSFGLGEPDIDGGAVEGRCCTSPSSRGLLAIATTDDEPVPLLSQSLVEDHLRLTVQRWREWSSSIDYEGPWAEPVRRSALALKLLLYTPTGAIAAAPTTSLPERLGGDRNWDYRYMWIRDSSFALDALISLNLAEEAHAAISWLISVARRHGSNLRVFYGLDGRIPNEESELDVPGYRGSRPVRAGNSAVGQLQLGTFGDLFDTIFRYEREGHILDASTQRLLGDMADRCCDLWQSEDSGLWELPDRRHYTISKIGCWVALDRAYRLNRSGALVSPHPLRWAGERDAIKAWVYRHCWSTEKNSLTFYAGSEDLDAATLLAGRTGFDRGEALAATVTAIQRELRRGPAVWRYTGMRDEEGAFIACSFWLVSALVALGRCREAHELMEGAVAMANDVGLLSEEFDADSGALLGNFPQGLSHLALINAATDYRKATGRPPQGPPAGDPRQDGPWRGT